jgi:hypothetical protein
MVEDRVNMSPTESQLDQILALQIAVARLGEKPFRFWWNSDVADVDGGADLLTRLVGQTMSPLSVIEGVLLAAKQTEERLLAAIPAPPAYSLFCPEPALRRALKNRIRHFKNYPEELPDRLRWLVSTECGSDDLLATIGAAARGDLEIQKTSFGVALQMGPSSGEPLEPTRLAAALASIAADCPRGGYSLPYYREDARG